MMVVAEITHCDMPGSIEVSRATLSHENGRFIVLVNGGWALCVAEFLQELTCPRYLRRCIVQRDKLSFRRNSFTVCWFSCEGLE